MYKLWWDFRNNLCELFIRLSLWCQTEDYESSVDLYMKEYNSVRIGELELKEFNKGVTTYHPSS